MSASCNARRRPPRRGYTLIELLVSMSTGALVLGGLASTLYISTKTLTPDATAASESNRSSLALARIAADLRLALNFTERTATALTFTVPDRTGDGAVDTIRYSWSGTQGDPLLYQFNADAAVAVATNVQQLNFSSLTRTIPAASTALSSTIVAYAPPPETKVSTDGTNITIARPPELVPGNLMLAAVAVDGSVSTTLAAPSGWTLLCRQADSAGEVSFGLWWKVAGASEAANYSFTWTGAQNAYGWIMRFGGVKASAPINAWTSLSGASILMSHASPAVTTTVDNCMIVRLGAFDGDQVDGDNPGILGYTALTADRSVTGSGAASGAAAYAMKSSAGASPATTFLLLTGEQYVTATIALRPDDGL